MILRRWVAATTVLLTSAALASPVIPAAAGDREPSSRLNLPNGWQPEGITTDGDKLYVGSLANGAIWRVNLETERGRVLHRGAEGRVAVGIDYDDERDLLWVAGGPTEVVRAHDADTGRILRTYSFPGTPSRFINDLVVTRHGVYATDSTSDQLLVVPLRKGSDRLPARGAARVLTLTGDFEPMPSPAAFNLNGIVKSGKFLLAVQSETGQLFRINPWTGRTRLVNLGGFEVTNGDGLEIDDDILYAVQNRSNMIAVIDLSDNLLRGRVIVQLGHPQFDVPTTVALARDSLWAANARFGTTAPVPVEKARYWVTRVPSLDGFDD